ncbi:MAG: hypothetical protein M1828_005756 [Chrysothrix sp. TS-e1954]|nr:MAG: hypothetical protein M1828_005756 [Chrysothrix sp. TS-e1954]
MTDHEEAPSGGMPSANQITFNIKSSSDQKHVVTVADSMTVQQLKQKLSTGEYADVAAERQRLIYSGRVLKDPDTLASYNIKDGNTVHLVKGAPPSRPTPDNSASTASSGANGVPTNLAAGTGNDPLAGLTGARYAGFAQMPGADMFGADGGMGAPQSPEDLIRMLENPMFQSQMNEAMNNPQVIQMMQNNPMMRDQPMMREMLNNPEMRRMMMDPQVIRASLQMQGMMGGRGGNGGNASMPMPGVTDTTEGAQTQQQNQAQNPTSQPANPFAAMMGGGMGGGTGAGGNPYAAMFPGNMNPMNPPAAGTPTQNPATQTANTDTPDTRSSDTQPQQQQQQQQQHSNQQQQPNPFSALFGGAQPGSNPQQQNNNPFTQATQSLMQNPEMMRNMMNMMGMGGGGASGATADPSPQGTGSFNPMNFIGNPGMGGFGGQPSQPQDLRPPEEMYAEQIRQLNDMGFFEFERNVRALRMSGGRVEGAVELLLGGTV